MVPSRTQQSSWHFKLNRAMPMPENKLKSALNYEWILENGESKSIHRKDITVSISVRVSLRSLLQARDVRFTLLEQPAGDDVARSFDWPDLLGKSDQTKMMLRLTQTPALKYRPIQSTSDRQSWRACVTQRRAPASFKPSTTRR